MKKSFSLILICCFILAACTSSPTIKRSPPSSGKDGGYYPGDGPHAKPPKNLDDIPNAVPKNEPLYKYSTKPYIALGKKYYPLKTADNYKKRGVASWYGKLFHGNKTANGEIYDMYSMTAAHTILPLPSYVKVTNVQNGRSVIVRVNDRGPFKHNREIDLSYAAAYQLRLIEKGSGLVEVETVKPGQQPSTKTTAVTQPTIANTDTAVVQQHYVQAGAFSEETNAMTLQKRIQALDHNQSGKVKRVYNNGLHRLIIGPYNTRQEAEKIANNINYNLNISTIITTKQ
ncbi:MAG: septal ring lytic transglycosylase RlpA family protein [Methylophilaceae bacterium]